MKKLRLLLAVVVMLAALLGSAPLALADDEAYVIESMDISVDVQDDRRFHVTEVIEVDFREPRRGIIRDIPTSSDAESYSVEDIRVSGAPATVSETAGAVSIRIGDPDKEITGRITYTISYTLVHYADYLDTGDYIYMNIIGAQWDTRIESARGVITYPPDAQLQALTVTSGSHGQTTNAAGVTVTQRDNQIIVETSRALRAYEGITVNARLNEGAFKNAPVYTFPYTILSSDIDIEITHEQEYLIRHRLALSVAEQNQRIQISLHKGVEGPVRVSDFSCSDASADAYPENGFVALYPKQGSYDVTLSYKLTPALGQGIGFEMIDTSLDAPIESFDASISLPFALAGYRVDFGRRGDVQDASRFEATVLGNALNVRTTRGAQPAERLNIRLDVDGSLFSRPLSAAFMLTIAVSVAAVLLVAFLYIKFGRDVPLAPIVGFYPPEGMSSAEVGFVIDRTADANDITSLLYYWASHGHMRILDIDKTITFERISALDDKHRAFERAMFESMFKKGDGQSVTTGQLQGDFYADIQRARVGVHRLFTGKRALTDAKAGAMQALAVLISALPLLMLGVAAARERFSPASQGLVMALMASAPLIAAFGLIRASLKGALKARAGGRFGRALLAGVAVLLAAGLSYAMLAGGDAPAYITWLAILSAYASMATALFVSRRSDFGVDILQRVLGFRNFMEAAEKQRLEALLESDPEYFYNTLPFAQVLGVTRKWSDKFADIAMQPPGWYYSDRDLTGYAMIMMMNRQMSVISTTVSTPPVTQNTGSGGGFSGGGGGFSGGGFSGGGSGGGGGSSW